MGERGIGDLGASINGGCDMGGVEGGVTLVRMYCIREKSVFNLKRKKKGLSEGGSIYNDNLYM